MTQRLLTTREVADRLGVIPETVLRWIETRGLPAIRLTSRALRYDEAALDAWIAQHTVAASPGREVSAAPTDDAAKARLTSRCQQSRCLRQQETRRTRCPRPNEERRPPARQWTPPASLLRRRRRPPTEARSRPARRLPALPRRDRAATPRRETATDARELADKYLDRHALIRKPSHDRTLRTDSARPLDAYGDVPPRAREDE